MPQVVRLALPGLINIWISVLKDTALVALAGLNEIVARSKIAAGATKEPFLFFILAALFFVVISSATLQSVGAAGAAARPQLESSRRVNP